MTSFLGLPVIVAETSNETNITYSTPVDSKIFGLSSFDSTYVRGTDTTFDMRFVEGGIVVAFTRNGVNFADTRVTKGNAAVRWDAEVATIAIALSKGTTVYNVFNYRITISREESQGNVFFLYTASLLLPGTARTTYTVVMQQQAESTALFRVLGKEEANILLFGGPGTVDFYDAKNRLIIEALVRFCVSIESGISKLKGVSNLSVVMGPGSFLSNESTFNRELKEGESGFYTIVSNASGNNCNSITFPRGAYYEVVTLFPLKNNLFFASTPVADSRSTLSLYRHSTHK